MGTAPSRKHELGIPREDMERMLMCHEINHDDDKFIVEYDKAGLRFLLREVRQRKRFQQAFDRLVSKGCRADFLFIGLHYLLRSERREALCQLPGKREIRFLVARLRKGVEEIRAFEKKYAEAHVLRVFNQCLRHVAPYDCGLYFNVWNPISQAEAETYGVTHHMLAYAEMLQSWWTPRSDTLKSYGSIYNCVYAKVATGKPQFSIVAELNTSFLGSPIEPDTLRKNLSRFAQRNRRFYLQMVSDLRSEHEPTGGEMPGPVDWSKLLDRNPDKLK